MFPLGGIRGVSFGRPPNAWKLIVTVETPTALGCAMGKGNSPPARKLACLPFTAIRLGSARICRRFLCCRALTTAPRLMSVRATKILRKSLMFTVGGVEVVVVVVELPLVVVV